MAIRIISSRDTAAVAALLDRRARRDRGIEDTVARIIARVRREGDDAVISYARTFDRLEEPIAVTPRAVAARAAASR